MPFRTRNSISRENVPCNFLYLCLSLLYTPHFASSFLFFFPHICENARGGREGWRELGGVRSHFLPHSSLPSGPVGKEIHSREEKKVKKDASSSLLSLREKGRKFTYGPWPTNPANALRFPSKKRGDTFSSSFLSPLGKLRSSLSFARGEC